MKNIFYILLISALSVVSLQAQDRTTSKADTYFERIEYVKAAKEYNKIVEKGGGSPYVYKRLAEASFFINNTKDAERFYKMLLRNEDNASAEDYFRYSQALKANGKNDLAKEAMQKFATMAPEDPRAKAFIANPNYMDELENKQPSFSAKILELSSPDYADFGAYEHNGMLYFVSSRNKSRKKHAMTGQPVLDVFVAENVAGTFKNEKEVEGSINSNFNEGTVAITNDGKTIYFTRNNLGDGRKYEANSEGIGQLRLYRASLVSGRWRDVEPLEFTEDEFSYSHPALSPDNKYLYFSSDMPGGYGQSDIYKVEILKEGFGEPVNLGPSINTPGRESFPFLDDENRLFFSSDGHLGLGGLDVFYVTLNSPESAPTNLGKPVNTKADDFAFSYYSAKKSGYVSSNRDGLGIVDNIYQVDLIQPLDETLLLVAVTDAETGKPIVGAEVLIYDEDKNEVKKGKTKGDGVAQLLVISNMKYDVQANMSGYESASTTIEAVGDEMPVDLALSPIEELLANRRVVLDQIYFDFDKSEIKPTAALELDKLIETLKKYDDIRIKVESHTDRRGTVTYNLTLSERRAKSTVDYMISQGIDASRLEFEGLGKSQPLVDCGSKCTEDEHRKNRRSEFIIIEEKEGVETIIETTQD